MVKMDFNELEKNILGLESKMNELTFLRKSDMERQVSVDREVDTLEEKCAGCGECLLALTGDICPVARCSKELLNGVWGAKWQM